MVLAFHLHVCIFLLRDQGRPGCQLPRPSSTHADPSGYREDQKHFEEKFVTPLYDQIGVSTTKPANYQLKIDELVIKEQAIREAVVILKDYYLSQGAKTVSNEK